VFRIGHSTNAQIEKAGCSDFAEAMLDLPALIQAMSQQSLSQQLLMAVLLVRITAAVKIIVSY